MAKTKITLSLSILLAFFLSPVPAFCAGTSGRGGQISFEWRRVAMDGHRTASGTAPVSSASIREKQLIESCESGLAYLKKVVAVSARELEVYRPQSPLGNLVADIMFEESEKVCGVKCDLAITNVGGIRQSMPKGNVLMDDIVSMFPFKNTLVVSEVRGYRLLELFNLMARQNWEAFAGAKVVVDADTVKSITVGGEPLEAMKIYRVITNSFLFLGGDGLSIKKISEEEGLRESTVLVVDAVLDYLNALTASGRQITSAIDDRVTFAGGVSGFTGAHEAKSDPSCTVSINPRVAAPDKGARKTLTILHTNDTHSAIEPLRFGSHAGMGGVVERAAFIDSVRLADGKENVLLLDAGDYSQGSSYFTTFGGKVEVKAMNIMRYDVATIGNHEWDNGAACLTKRLRESRWTSVLCNYALADRDVSSCLKPYVIVRRGGLKIGIIGTLANVTEVVNKAIVKDMNYIDPAIVVNKWAKVLREEKKCDLVIMLSHCGLQGRYINDKGDLQIAPHLRGVDIIIGGHTHSDLTAPIYVDGADGEPVMVVTDYCKGVYVGQIDCYR